MSRFRVSTWVVRGEEGEKDGRGKRRAEEMRCTYYILYISINDTNIMYSCVELKSESV